MFVQNLDKFLWFPEGQRPLVFQLGGSDPATLAQAATKVAEYGYDEINLNCGCPRCGGAHAAGHAVCVSALLARSPAHRPVRAHTGGS